MPDIYSYLKPEEVLKIILEGIDKDLRFMDSLFLFVTVISTYLFLPYIPYIRTKFFTPKITRKQISDTNYSNYIEKNSEINVLGFKINRQQIIYIALIATIVHLTLGITLNSKTNLIIEIKNSCDTALVDKSKVDSENHFIIDSIVRVDSSIKKQIAQSFLFQSVSNSRLFQIFNFEKMFITRKDFSFGITEIFRLFILIIPFILFSFFFFIVGFEWLNKAKLYKPSKRKIIYKLSLVLIIYTLNLYSFYLWIGGIKSVADLIGFRYNIKFL